ncbi:MAG TPA: DUF2490 domain-containing protein [Bacteroidales bacterium]|nr:DUF2490 domain-containing protein [Bacteroidales bacterium]HSA43718.1 DUF2490 domain-containing protein [Bacteroidales bacterium]
MKIPLLFRIGLFAVLVCNLHTASLVSAQVNDAGLWLSLNAEKKVTSRFSVTMSAESRFNENISEAGTIFADMGLDYRLHKNLRVSANYRFSGKRRLDDSYSTRHRWYAQVTIREKVDRIRMSFRTRFQTQFTDLYSSPDGKIPEYTTRFRLNLSYNNKSAFEPYVNAELFLPLELKQNQGINQTRYMAGVEYRLNRKHMFELFYLFQREYGVKNPEFDYVTGIGYYFSL